MTEKLTCAKMNEFLRDEEKGTRDYANFGEKKLSSDESGHASYWREKIKKHCK
ncbi:MAG: hypothetical protein PHF86_12460 [Candidatus Nanoarchaeia archaeon]|nr:hypothetical protein [Candidatus Nanoarchaeia archaeon]